MGKHNQAVWAAGRCEDGGAGGERLEGLVEGLVLAHCLWAHAPGSGSTDDEDVTPDRGGPLLATLDLSDSELTDEVGEQIAEARGHTELAATLRACARDSLISDGAGVPSSSRPSTRAPSSR